MYYFVYVFPAGTCTHKKATAFAVAFYKKLPV